MTVLSSNADSTIGRRAWRYGLCGVGALAALASTAAFAQGKTPGLGQSPTIDRDRLDRADPAIPRAAAPAHLPAAPVVVAPTATVQVSLTQVRFEGATLDSRILDETTRPFLGAALDRGTLQKLANAVSATYAQSDIAFYAVTIPAQSAAGGVLVMRVTEGHIAEYKLTSQTRSTPKRLIDAHVRRLMRETPTHKSTIERTLSILRDIPGQTVHASLRSTSKAGELALDLDVKRKQVEVTVNLNNRGVVNVTSGAQAQVSMAFNGLLREGDTTRVSGYLPFEPNRYQFYTASHATPVGSNGTTIGVSGAYVRTRTRDLGILGEAKQAGIVIAHPLIRSYTRNLTVTASLDGTNSDNYYLDTAFGGFRTRAIRLGASWSSVNKNSGYGLSVSFSQGLDGLGAREIAGYSKSPFRKINAQLTVINEFSPRISVKLTARGQYSSDRLPTTERFVAGGDGAGLAFRDGFITADRAVSGGAELSYRLIGGANSAGGASVFTYADAVLAGSLSRPLYGLGHSDHSLASAGGGVRITPFRGWQATAQIAIPVKAPFANVSKKARFFFGVSRTL